MEKRLNDLAQQVKEIDLNHLKNRLAKFQRKLNRPTNVSIRRHLTSFIDYTDDDQLGIEWKQDATIIAGGNSQEYRLDQLNCPSGICFDRQNQIIYVILIAAIIDFKNFL